MNADNQTYVIFFLGAALIIGLWTGSSESIITGLIGALAGMFMGKTMNEHQTELVDNQIIDSITSQVQKDIIEEMTTDGGINGATDNERTA